MTDKPILYGIANCDTMKKARSWLSAEGLEYAFHDYRKQGLESGLLQSWVDELGWEALINRRGTTWRRLPEQVRETLDADSAIGVMLENPAIIKRPLMVVDGEAHLGFSDDRYSQIFGA